MKEGRDVGIYVWLRLLLQAGKVNDNGLIYLKRDVPYTIQMLAVLFERPVDIIERILEILVNFEMIEIYEDGTIKISNWEKHQNVEGMKKVREGTRERVKNCRERKKEKELLEQEDLEDYENKHLNNRIKAEKLREEETNKKEPSRKKATEEKTDNTKFLENKSLEKIDNEKKFNKIEFEEIGNLNNKKALDNLHEDKENTNGKSKNKNCNGNVTVKREKREEDKENKKKNIDIQERERN